MGIINSSAITDNFSGSDRAVSPVFACMSVCVSTITSELNDLSLRYLLLLLDTIQLKFKCH